MGMFDPDKFTNLSDDNLLDTQLENMIIMDHPMLLSTNKLMGTQSITQANDNSMHMSALASNSKMGSTY